MDSPEYMMQEIKHLRGRLTDAEVEAERLKRLLAEAWADVERLNEIIARSEDSLTGIPEYEEGNTVKPGFEIEPIKRRRP